jgi:hypothetical protein
MNTLTIDQILDHLRVASPEEQASVRAFLAPPKRGPGRPKKIQSSETPDTGSVTGSVTSAAPLDEAARLQKAVEKALAKVARDTEKAAAKAEREAKKAAEKEARDAKKAAEKEARDVLRALEKEARDAQRILAKEEKKQQKAAEKAAFDARLAAAVEQARAAVVSETTA